jgi:hypothetical protein
MDVTPTPDVAAQTTRPQPVDSVWGRDGFGFDDLIDVVNPLQHLPGIGQAYRAVTGDELGLLPRIAGGLLFGGPLGAAVSMVTGGVEAGTGRTPGEHALAALQGEGAPPAAPPPTRVAAAYAPPPAPAPPPPPAAPTPHAPAAAATEAAAGEAAVAALPAGWAPPLSSASERLLAEMAGGDPARSTG